MGAGSKKIGRNKKFCDLYKTLGRREKNKAIKKIRQAKKEAKKKAQLEKRELKLNPVKQEKTDDKTTIQVDVPETAEVSDPTPASDNVRSDTDSGSD